MDGVNDKVEEKPWRFQKGGKPGPGRRKKTFTLQVRDLCQSMDVNPIKIALDLIASGKLPGTAERASMAQRLKALDAILPFCTPKLSSNTSVAAVQVEQTTTAFDVTELMRDPKLAEAAQTVALALTESKGGPPTHSWLAIDGPHRRGGDE